MNGARYESGPLYAKRYGRKKERTNKNFPNLTDCTLGTNGLSPDIPNHLMIVVDLKEYKVGG
jgi:hypothetical protein